MHILGINGVKCQENIAKHTCLHKYKKTWKNLHVPLVKHKYYVYGYVCVYRSTWCIHIHTGNNVPKQSYSLQSVNPELNTAFTVLLWTHNLLCGNNVHRQYICLTCVHYFLYCLDSVMP